MIVMKFGGTSIEDAAAMRRVMAIVGRELPRSPLVVVSACSGVTNDLLEAAQRAARGDSAAAHTLLERLRERHERLAGELIGEEQSRGVCRDLKSLVDELWRYFQGVHLLRELTARSLDAMLSFGERLSSLVLHRSFVASGVPSVLIDARDVMVTNDEFSSAQPLMPLVAERAQKLLRSNVGPGRVTLTQGFIGRAQDGSTTTIGRGGSDLTASILGSVLEAEEIQIWTDVDGMMTADPRVIPDARPVSAMSFQEASELAYFGAKVLHPRTIMPAIERNIPVRVLNSRRMEMPGTLIVRSLDSGSPESRGDDIIKSIAFKKGITVINVSSSRMLMAHGFLARLFSIFAEQKKSVDVVATSEVSVSLTIDSNAGLNEILHELETIGETRVVEKKAILCIVGEGMKQKRGIAARIFAALARTNVNVEMVSEGASEINLTLVVDEEDVTTAVRALHDEFFTKGTP